MKSLLLPLLLLAALPLFAQSPEHELRIRKTVAPMKLDGALDEAVWQSPEAARNFTRNFPVDTGLAKMVTEVRMAFDGDNLYVGAVCWQRREDYTVQSLKRDFPGGTSDVVNVLLDPSKDGLNGFIFSVSPLNVQREALLSNGQNMAFEWDNVWHSAVQNYDDRWTVEMAIPFKTLRYKVSPGQNTWRANFIRTKLKDWEVSTWKPVPRQFVPNNLAFAGTLIWDEPPPPAGMNLSVIPYTTTGYAVNYLRDDNLNVLEKPDDFTKRIGGDAKIAITPSLNLDLTFNPDFSQVEVDQQVANLSRFELFFPERRQFFLENRDLFAMFGFPETRPFFSRRVGLARNPLTGQNETVPILAGARLSGKITDDWRVGLLNMQTDRVNWNADTVLPAANFTVATVQRKMFNRSTLSAIFVDKENFLGKLSEAQKSGHHPWHRVAGLEYNMYSKDNRWEGEWYYHRSFSPDPAQRGATYATFMGYNVREWNIFGGYHRVDKTYTADAGFVPRLGVQSAFTGINRKWYRQTGKLAYVGVGTETNFIFDLDGKATDRDIALNVEAELSDQTYMQAGVYHQYTYLFGPFDPTNLEKEPDDFLPADSGFVYHGFQGEVFTSSTYDWQGGLELTAGGFFNGTIVSAEGFLSYRAQPLGIFSLRYSYNRIRLPEPYASADFWLLGPRAELSFSRNLFVSAFFQYNTQANNFNINTRLQWRFAPVSDVFLVYTDNSFAERIPNTPVRFFSPKNKAIVLKIVYWLNL